MIFILFQSAARLNYAHRVAPIFYHCNIFYTPQGDKCILLCSLTCISQSVTSVCAVSTSSLSPKTQNNSAKPGHKLATNLPQICHNSAKEEQHFLFPARQSSTYTSSDLHPAPFSPPLLHSSPLPLNRKSCPRNACPCSCKPASGPCNSARSLRC